MKKRKKLSKFQSKKKFTKGAVKTHKWNINDAPMRGGIRM